MELLDRMSALRSRAEGQRAVLDSQRKTENALVLPFFQALGYDPFDVREVEPEFTVGLDEQGMTTVDFALKKQGAPVMLVQCETAETDLGAYDNRFLVQHFDRLATDVALFTNGLRYRFYANLDAGIAVDGRPFLEFNLLDHGPDQVEELGPLTQPAFNTDEVLSTAYDLKVRQLLRAFLMRQQHSPDDHLVRFLATQIYEGDVSDDAIERLRPVVQDILGELFEGNHQNPPSAPSLDDQSEAADDTEPTLPDREAADEAPEVVDAGSEAELSAPNGNSPASGEETATGDEGEPAGKDSFEKGLARRVIGSF